MKKKIKKIFIPNQNSIQIQKIGYFGLGFHPKVSKNGS